MFFRDYKVRFFLFAYPVVEAVEAMLFKGAKGNADWRGVQQCDNDGEGGGVFVLQPQDERSDRCAGYGDSAGAVFGVVDGGGFFAGLEALVLARVGREGGVLHNARRITAVGLRGTVSYFGGVMLVSRC